MSESNRIDIKLPGGGLNLNRPETVGKTLHFIAAEMLKTGDNETVLAGKWLGCLADGFADCLAGGQKDHVSCRAQVSAATTVYSMLLAMMVGAISCDREELQKATYAVTRAFVENLSKMVVANIGNKAPAPEAVEAGSFEGEDDNSLLDFFANAKPTKFGFLH